MNKTIFLLCAFILGGCSASNNSHLQEGELTALSFTESGLIDQFEPKKLSFKYEYEQIDLNKHQMNQLLYLYDWDTGVNLKYGKASADSEYKSLAIGHKRMKSLEKALIQNDHSIKGIAFEPNLSSDAVIITEYVNKTLKERAIE